MAGRSKPAVVELICVGTELLGDHVNTHEAYIGRTLRERGLSLSRAVTMPDDEKPLRRAVAESLRRCDVLITSGGLGPTFDDLTREAVAGALGRKLVFKPALWREIEAKLTRRHMPVPEENKRQAYAIDGAKILKNARGSAPGQLVRRARAGRPPQLIALLPGPYSELSPIFEERLLPVVLREHARGLHARSAVFRLSGVTESFADEKLSALTSRPPEGASFTILAGGGQVDFHARVVDGDARRAERTLEYIRARVRQAVGAHLFGEGDASLESAIGAALAERGWTLAVAESCTGGGLGQKITSVPGSSKYFRGGVIAYANELKRSLLGVSARTLARHGAVSAECAREMARGARRACGATLGLSITGIAGPAGGSDGKPVGLVHVGVAGPGEGDCFSRELRLGSERGTIRARSAAAALDAVLRLCRERALA